MSDNPYCSTCRGYDYGICDQCGAHTIPVMRSNPCWDCRNGMTPTQPVERGGDGGRACPSCGGKGGDMSGPCWDCQGGTLA